MRAYVIKTKTGFVGFHGQRSALNEADLFTTKRKAERSLSFDKNGEAISVEIKLIKKKKKGKTK